MKGRRLLLEKGWTFLFILSISIDEIKGGVLGMKNIPKADAIAITTLLRVEIGQHCQLTIYGYDCVCDCVGVFVRVRIMITTASNNINDNIHYRLDLSSYSN